MSIWMRFDGVIRIGVVALISLFFMASPEMDVVMAQSTQLDVDELLHGEALAKTNCGQCHNIGLDGDSANKNAPPFRKLGERRAIETIAPMLVNKESPEHTDMPRFTITAIQAMDIAEWIYWVQPVAHGKRLVKEYCARCHAVELDDESKHSAAAPFRYLAKLYPIAFLEEAFAERIETGHPDMPVFEVRISQLRDMIAYIETIQKP